MTSGRLFAAWEIEQMDFGHGFMECWVEDEESGSCFTDLVEIVWCRGKTLEIDCFGSDSYGYIDKIISEYNRPGGSRIWTEKPDKAQMETARWLG